MRWLALKDLQILRRSPLIVGLLLVYAVGLSLLVGTAVDSGPRKPVVAVVNEIPPDQNEFSLGNEQVDATRYAASCTARSTPSRSARARRASPRSAAARRSRR